MLKRISALLCALILLSCSMCGCSDISVFPPVSPIPSASPLPPAAATTETGLELAKIDREIAMDILLSDGLTYSLLIVDPSKFSESVDHKRGWGDTANGEIAASKAQNEAWLTQLSGMDASELTETERITRTTLMRFLETEIEKADFPYYYEALDAFVGVHSSLPINMTFFGIDTESDIEDYLCLLEDAPRYLSLELELQRKKAADGYFMSAAALSIISDQLNDIIKSRDNFFLRTTFADSIADIGLDPMTRQHLLDRNNAAVDALIDAYSELYDGLEALSDSCTEGGLYAHGDEGRRCFELMLKDAACRDITPNEAIEILITEINRCMEVTRSCYSADPSVSDLYGDQKLSLGNVEKNIEYLKSLAGEYYPELPAHTVVFTYCPKELEDQFSPAAYLIPPIDDPSQNLIIMNRKSIDSANGILTVAHEGYPGHMYHYQYIRGIINQTGYARQVLPLTGYYECWSQAAEMFFCSNNTRFDRNYCNYFNANMQLTNLYFPAYFSILVNRYGYTESDIFAVLKKYYLRTDAAELADSYYNDAIISPSYFLEYALGCAAFQQELRKAETMCGSSFDYKAYNKAFLDIGPAYFDTILPIMDRWIAENS